MMPRAMQQAVQSSSSPAGSATAGTDRVQRSKHALWAAIDPTSRGGSSSTEQRGRVEEAQVALEACAPDDLDFGALQGTWRLAYTTAPDVAPLVTPAATQGPGPLRVGAIYQSFSGVDEGRVENIIKFGVWPLLQDGEGASLRVGANFEPRGRRSILLRFEDVRLGELKVSAGAQAALAPALLPRGWLNQQLLLAVQEFRLRIPLNERPSMGMLPGSGFGAIPSSNSSDGGGGSKRGQAVGFYQLTYCDEDTLVGRGSNGTFIFKRAPGPV